MGKNRDDLSQYVFLRDKAAYFEQMAKNYEGTDNYDLNGLFCTAAFRAKMECDEVANALLGRYYNADSSRRRR